MPLAIAARGTVDQHDRGTGPYVRIVQIENSDFNDRHFLILGSISSLVKCLLWVKSRHFHCTSPCLLYPQKQTYAVQLGMSALGQKRTSHYSTTSSVRR